MQINKLLFLKIVNPLLGLAFLFQISSGFAMGFDSSHVELWAETHEVCAWILIALLALHIWLNWGWIKTNMLKLGAKKDVPK